MWTRSKSVNLTKLTCIQLVMTVLISPEVLAYPGTYLCDANFKCLNGGIFQLPDNPFGFCRCVCKKRFAGPRCQFGSRTRRINRWERLLQIRNGFQEFLHHQNSKRWHRKKGHVSYCCCFEVSLSNLSDIVYFILLSLFQHWTVSYVNHRYGGPVARAFTSQSGDCGFDSATAPYKSLLQLYNFKCTNSQAL